MYSVAVGYYISEEAVREVTGGKAQRSFRVQNYTVRSSAFLVCEQEMFSRLWTSSS